MYGNGGVSRCGRVAVGELVGRGGAETGRGGTMTGRGGTADGVGSAAAGPFASGGPPLLSRSPSVILPLQWRGMSRFSPANASGGGSDARNGPLAALARQAL